MGYLNGLLKKHPTETENGLFEAENGQVYEFNNEACHSTAFLSNNQDKVFYDINKSPIDRPMRALIENNAIVRIYKRIGFNKDYFIGAYCENEGLTTIKKTVNPESELALKQNECFSSKDDAKKWAKHNLEHGKSEFLEKKKIYDEYMEKIRAIKIELNNKLGEDCRIEYVESDFGEDIKMMVINKNYCQFRFNLD